jgi:hypothetical protein
VKIDPLPDTPLAGGSPYAVGQSSIVRIPVPGTNGLAIELSPRGWTPKGGSTSTLFFQVPTGMRHLRLDRSDQHDTDRGDDHAQGVVHAARVSRVQAADKRRPAPGLS